MLFHKADFILFLTLLAGVFYSLPKKLKPLILLVGSLVFYAQLGIFVLIPLVISILTDYFIGPLIFKSPSQGWKKSLLFLSLIINLGLLIFFKYFIDYNAPPTLFGDDMTRIFFPIGISFYTFQSLSYTFDIYLKKIEPEKNFIKFALYVSFFPQLLAGPIEKARTLLPQFSSDLTIKKNEIEGALFLLLWGCFKKKYIADQIIPVTDYYSSKPESFTLAILASGLVFHFKLYADFSGYTDMARGAAKLFGIDLSLNFKRFYYAKTPGDYWQRWHLSMTKWINSYLYRGFGPRWKNIHFQSLYTFFVFCLFGLWHSADSSFLLFGAFQGLAFLIYRYSKKVGLNKIVNKLRLAVPLMIIFFTLTAIFPMMADQKRLIEFWNGFYINEMDVKESIRIILFFLVHFLPMFVLEYFQERKNDELVVLNWNPYLRASVYFLIFLFISFSSGVASNFFYYQF